MTATKATKRKRVTFEDADGVLKDARLRVRDLLDGGLPASLETDIARACDTLLATIRSVEAFQRAGAPVREIRADEAKTYLVVGPCSWGVGTSIAEAEKIAKRNHIKSAKVPFKRTAVFEGSAGTRFGVDAFGGIHWESGEVVKLEGEGGKPLGRVE